MTAAKLAAAIDTAVSNPGIQQRAAELGQIIRQEDSISRAVDLMKQIVHPRNR
jgi:hypothetical protein